jgi:hypothetical protein
MERFIGYIVTFGALMGMGFGLPRWFEWRRSLFNDVRREGEHARHV